MTTVEEMCALVEDYIFDMKGVRIKIMIHTPFAIVNDLHKLSYAYGFALDYYNEH